MVVRHATCTPVRREWGNRVSPWVLDLGIATGYSLSVQPGAVTGDHMDNTKNIEDALSSCTITISLKLASYLLDLACHAQSGAELFPVTPNGQPRDHSKAYEQIGAEVSELAFHYLGYPVTELRTLIQARREHVLRVMNGEHIPKAPARSLDMSVDFGKGDSPDAET